MNHIARKPYGAASGSGAATPPHSGEVRASCGRQPKDCDQWDCCHNPQAIDWKARAEKAERDLAEARAALTPFATRFNDVEIYKENWVRENALANMICVGDWKLAAAIIENAGGTRK